MSDNILGVLNRYLTAWAAGDLAGIVGSYHDDMVLHWGGANPLSGAHVGKPAALQALGAMAQRAQRRLVRVVDVMAGDAHGVAVTIEAFARDGRSAEIERVLVFKVKDGLLAECRVLDRDPALVDWFLRD